jgi:hypothetical protein
MSSGQVLINRGRLPNQSLCLPERHPLTDPRWQEVADVDLVCLRTSENPQGSVICRVATEYGLSSERGYRL